MKRKKPNMLYFTRKLLLEAARLGSKWNLGWFLTKEVAELPDHKYPVEAFEVRCHHDDQVCEPFVRCFIRLEEEFLLCDMPIEFFERICQESRGRSSTPPSRRAGKRKEAVTA